MYAAAMCMISILFLASAAIGQTVVKVGITSIQPPLVIDAVEKRGLVYDVVAALNELQSDYQFKAYHYPAKRLLVSYRDEDVHLVAYNDVKWGWLERDGVGSVDMIDGRDLFFTLRGYQPPTQRPEQIGAVRGFHYAFADFDSAKLSQMPNVSLVNNEDGVLRLVEHGRVDKGIVSETFLEWIAVSEPDVYQALEIDREHPDDTYHRQFVAFPYSPISVTEFNRLVMQLTETGDLQEIYARYGLTVPAALDEEGADGSDGRSYLVGLLD
ncbi:hypothetical protein [Thalassospira profundimaris]|uniref:hypothetical protein n=1 Tax=Thalassospira profundimaris TaxID=502049 RepID=UPI0002871D75|nr:hypothetical protein [Thalassospira profundimaris]EKF07099.1 extracellular solute-binding protein [Thalassospira profundimaris WP0211]